MESYKLSTETIEEGCESRLRDLVSASYPHDILNRKSPEGDILLSSETAEVCDTVTAFAREHNLILDLVDYDPESGVVNSQKQLWPEDTRSHDGDPIDTAVDEVIDDNVIHTPDDMVIDQAAAVADSVHVNDVDVDVDDEDAIDANDDAGVSDIDAMYNDALDNEAATETHRDMTSDNAQTAGYAANDMSQYNDQTTADTQSIETGDPLLSLIPDATDIVKSLRDGLSVKQLPETHNPYVDLMCRQCDIMFSLEQSTAHHVLSTLDSSTVNETLADLRQHVSDDKYVNSFMTAYDRKREFEMVHDEKVDELKHSYERQMQDWLEECVAELKERYRSEHPDTTDEMLSEFEAKIADARSQLSDAALSARIAAQNRVLEIASDCDSYMPIVQPLKCLAMKHSFEELMSQAAMELNDRASNAAVYKQKHKAEPQHFDNADSDATDADDLNDDMVDDANDNEIDDVNDEFEQNATSTEHVDDALDLDEYADLKAEELEAEHARNADNHTTSEDDQALDPDATGSLSDEMPDVDDDLDLDEPDSLIDTVNDMDDHAASDLTSILDVDDFDEADEFDEDEDEDDASTGSDAGDDASIDLDDLDDLDDFDNDGNVSEDEDDDADDKDDEDGEDEDKGTKKKMSPVKRVAIVAGLVAALGLVSACSLVVVPKLLNPTKQEQSSGTGEKSSASMKKLASKFKVNDKLSVSAGGKLVEVTIKELNSDGALCVDGDGNQWMVTPAQLERYIKSHPDKFKDNAETDNASTDDANTGDKQDDSTTDQAKSDAATPPAADDAGAAVTG